MADINTTHTAPLDAGNLDRTLRALHPSVDELEAAAAWAMTHDVSEGFRMLLKRLLGELGYEALACRI